MNALALAPNDNAAKELKAALSERPKILPNIYCICYQPPTPAKELLTEFWKREKESENMLENLAQRRTRRMQR